MWNYEKFKLTGFPTQWFILKGMHKLHCILSPWNVLWLFCIPAVKLDYIQEKWHLLPLYVSDIWTLSFTTFPPEHRWRSFFLIIATNTLLFHNIPLYFIFPTLYVQNCNKEKTLKNIGRKWLNFPTLPAE